MKKKIFEATEADLFKHNGYKYNEATWKDGKIVRELEIKNLEIPNWVTIIAEEAFAKCTSLTNMTLPDRVRSIEEEAFAKCTSLTSVTIPDSVEYRGGSIFWLHQPNICDDRQQREES